MSDRTCYACGKPLTPQQAWTCSPACKARAREHARRRVEAIVGILKDRAAIEAAKRAADAVAKSKMPAA